ncbi:MAG TPA: PAS domain S-box protein [Desulfobulbus sp.]|nr:PAS domain S-box protein [Desulfobulbus sp.]
MNGPETTHDKRHECNTAITGPENLLREVFNKSEDAIFILRVGTEQFIDCNPAAVTMFRAPDKETIIGLHPSEISPARQADGSPSGEKAKTMIARALARSFYRFEWLHRRTDGTDFPCRVTLTKGISGGESVLHAILEDVTAQKEQEHQLKIFREAMEQSMDGIAMANMEGQVQFVNPAWADMHGFCREQLIGRNLRIFHTDRQLKQDVEPFNEKVRDTGCFSGKIGHVTSEGRRFPTHMSTTMIRDMAGNPLGLVAIARDITEENKAEELRKSKEAAELANQAKSEFLANMSHELRTPMHAILSYANFGLRRADTLPRKKICEYFHEIAESGDRLLLLLNDLLDLEKLESGKMQYVRGLHAIVPGIRQVMDEFAIAANEKGIRLAADNSDDSLVAWFDPDRIGQVLRNLLSNAIKFSQPGKTIWLQTAKDTMQRDGKAVGAVRISVIDQGIGVPEDELESIFDKFVQSSKTKTNSGGTGLGLPICKQIIEKDSNGKIWAEPNPDGGTIFHVILPARHP